MPDKWESSKAGDIYLYFVTFAASKHLPVFDTLFVISTILEDTVIIYRYEGVASRNTMGQILTDIVWSRRPNTETVGKNPTVEEIQNLLFCND